MSAWGHAIAALSVEDVIRYIELQKQSQPGDRLARWCCCSAKSCWGARAYLIRYYYITGRAGRESFAEKFLCEQHGAKFAKQHGLTLPPANRVTVCV